MRVAEFAEKLNMKALTGEVGLDKEITDMYVCDLLSWVMSKAEKGDAWITVQNHVNIIAVALLAGISCIIVPENIEVEESTIKKAVKEGVPVLGTSMDAYSICWKAHELI